MGSALRKEVWSKRTLCYPKPSFSRMSEAKGDLIFLLSRENGLFWFSSATNNLSVLFSWKLLTPGGHSTWFKGEGSSSKSNHFEEISAFLYHKFIHITYYVPNFKAGDQASSNELFDNLRFILKRNIYHKADFLFYELIWKTQYQSVFFNHILLIWLCS